MRTVSLLCIFILFCSLRNYHLTFEVVKKSNKEFSRQNGKNEFHLLGNSVDTNKSIFVAEVKLKGEDVTVVELYAKLRQESQKLGANSFQILNHARENDNYYLLCNIFLTDTATLHSIKKNDTDNGKIFIVSAEPVGYLNKDKVIVNDSLNFTLLSGTYHSITIHENENYLIISNKTGISFQGNKNQAKYVSTRTVKYPVIQIEKPTYIYGGVSSNTTQPVIVKKKIKTHILENALGKLMVLYYKSDSMK